MQTAEKNCDGLQLIRSVRQLIFFHTKRGNQEVLTLHFSKCSNNCRTREVRTHPPPYVRLPLMRLALLLFSSLLPVLWTLLNLIRRALMFVRILGGSFSSKCQRISTSSGSFASPSTLASQRVSGSVALPNLYAQLSTVCNSTCTFDELASWNQTILNRRTRPYWNYGLRKLKAFSTLFSLGSLQRVLCPLGNNASRMVLRLWRDEGVYPRPP